MGKIGPRLSSRKKAKRWAKGQSSSSNPVIKKHRDQARSSFFQPIQGEQNEIFFNLDIIYLLSDFRFLFIL